MERSPTLKPKEFISAELQKVKHRAKQARQVAEQQLHDKAAKIKEKLEIERKKVQKRFRKLVLGDADRSVRDTIYKQTMEELSKPVTIKLADKLSFSFGIITMIITEGILLSFPSQFWMWYCFCVGPLMLIRYFLYRKLKYHFFMMDFCYLVQIVHVVTSLFFPTNRTLLDGLFALSNGPLCWAILAWRNSLVFHSLDKTTSLFIHAFPALLSFTTRWFHATPEIYDDAHAVGAVSFFGLSILMYLAWQVTYFVVVDIINAEKLRQDPDIQTSSRWFIRAKSGALFQTTFNLCRKTGVLGPDEEFNADQWKAKIVFAIAQLIYTVATMLPTYFLFHHPFVHGAFLLFMLFMAIWNGASYYIEVFSNRYVSELQRRVDVRAAQMEARRLKRSRERTKSDVSTGSCASLDAATYALAEQAILAAQLSQGEGELAAAEEDTGSASISTPESGSPGNVSGGESGDATSADIGRGGDSGVVCTEGGVSAAVPVELLLPESEGVLEVDDGEGVEAAAAPGTGEAEEEEEEDLGASMEISMFNADVDELR